jgi:trehalose-phosphatase
MHVLDNKADLDGFFAKLVSARECALLLDYDGTLAPFRIQRDMAIPYSGIQAALSQIMTLGNTRLVVVSGRPANEVVSLLEVDHSQPEIWGCHGWERLWPDGSYELIRIDKETLQGLTLAHEKVLALISSKLGRWFATESYVEQKPVGVALHWRGCVPEVIAAFRDHIAEEWQAWLTDNTTGLDLCEFDGGMELRVPGRTKADVVDTILTEIAEDAAVTYLGDDQTDEDAFRAMKGKGLTALVRPEVRHTIADLWIKPPDELIDFLWLWEDLRSRPGNGNLSG